jgi:hypothetical protein
MRFSDNPDKNNALIWFVIAAGSLGLAFAFAVLLSLIPLTFGRFYPLCLLGTLSFLGIVMGLAFYLSSRKYNSLVSGEDILARWSYRHEEIASALGEEEKRQKKMRMVVLFFIFLMLGMGLLFCFDKNGMDVLAVSEYAFLGLLTLAFIYIGLPAMGFGPSGAMDFILKKDSALFAGRFHVWRFWGSRLIAAEYTPGTPAMITIQYAVSSEYGPQVIHLSIPVPAGREREAERAVQVLVQGGG